MIVDARTIYGKQKGALETELSNKYFSGTESSNTENFKMEIYNMENVKMEISKKGCTGRSKTNVYERELTRIILQQEKDVKGGKFRNVIAG